MMRFEGKRALITGSSRGIGRAIALRLAQEGADVIVNYVRKGAAAQEVVSAIEAMGRRAVAVRANVAESEGVQRLVEAATDFGGIDFLISNAATGVMEPILSVTEKHWQWTMGANAWGFLYLTQQFTPMLQARGGGRIVALTSLGSTRTMDHYGLVGTSKAALEALVRYCAVELAPMGIIVNAVSPGLTDTAAAHFLPDADNLLVEAARQTPTKQIPTVEDAANVVAFLCSDDARMIVGQTILVDGGLSLRYVARGSSQAINLPNGGR
jgi:enoyl-[acyl-carrier protein] reductase III